VWGAPGHPFARVGLPAVSRWPKQATYRRRSHSPGICQSAWARHSKVSEAHGWAHIPGVFPCPMKDRLVVVGALAMAREVRLG
jgi:hypothetical protein